MNLIDAAERVLKAVGKPLHSHEIVEYARKRGWIVPQGRTPDHSLQAAIWLDIKHNAAQSRFRMVGQGRVKRKYSLKSDKSE